MDVDVIKSWLERSLRTVRLGKFASAVACLLLGVVVLFVSFWITYGAIWFVSHGFYRLSHNTILAIAGGFMALVVIAGAQQNWAELDPMERHLETARDMGISFSPYGLSYTTNAVKAGAFEVRSVASTINCILCGGVLLALGAVRKARELGRLQKMDIGGCAHVLALLGGAPQRLSFNEIVQALPDLNPVQVFEDLRYVDGVIFLTSDPPGLTLRPDLRTELNALAP